MPIEKEMHQKFCQKSHDAVCGKKKCFMRTRKNLHSPTYLGGFHPFPLHRKFVYCFLNSFLQGEQADFLLFISFIMAVPMVR